MAIHLILQKWKPIKCLNKVNSLLNRWRLTAKTFNSDFLLLCNTKSTVVKSINSTSINESPILKRPIKWMIIFFSLRLASWPIEPRWNGSKKSLNKPNSVSTSSSLVVALSPKGKPRKDQLFLPIILNYSPMRSRLAC